MYKSIIYLDISVWSYKKGSTVTCDNLMTKRYAYNSKPHKAVFNFNSNLYIKARQNLLKSDIFQTKPI